MGLKEKWLCAITIMFMFDFQVVYGCLEQERVALLHLKAEFNNPAPLIGSWKEDNTIDCCDNWYGVVCGADGRVFSLSLSNFYLHREFNTSLLLPLEQLRELDLSGNSITDWTETKGAKKLSSSLTKLELLYLGGNLLNGQILPQLSGFQSLRELYLGANNISGMIPLSDIEAFKNLKALALNDNAIDGFISHDHDSVKPSSSLTKLEGLDLTMNLLNMSILPQLSRLQSLKHLDLSYNQLGGAIRLNAFEAFNNLEELDLSGIGIKNVISQNDSLKLSSTLPKLRTLYLGGNHLDSSVLPHLRALPSLASLDLSGNQIGRLIRLNDFEGIKNLEQLFLRFNGIVSFTTDGPMKRSKLEQLDLSSNNLNSSSLPYLSGLPSSLKVLRLDENNLEGAIQFQDIMNIKNLEGLTLSGNRISGFTCYKGWRNSSKLELLDLSRNDFTEDISSCLQNLTSLQQVDLSYNRFHGELPWWLRSWTALQALNLSDNQFTGNVAKSPLVYLQSLRILKISNNRFQIPLSFKSFANHTKLKSFVADSNQAIIDESEPDVHPFAPGLKLHVLTLSRCSIDASLLNLLQHHHDLRLLELSHNSLQVTFPAWLLENNPLLDWLLLQNSSLVGPMQLPTRPHTYVRLINLSFNKIQGDIPANVSTLLPHLSWLEMSNNELKGSIPSSLCDTHTLSVLILRNNRLCGGLAPLAQGCFNLSSLDLSNNNLQGEIPSLYGLPQITDLLLSGNNLSGSIKDEIFYSPWSLESLVLSNNSLEGPIPKWLCRFQSIWLLDLSYNKINGSMPSCLMRLLEIQYLYLSNNKLSGPMKDTVITNTFGLELLDLRNNDLTGHIPSYIGDIPHLRVLLLGGNNFIGEIHFQLCNLLYLTLLDLSRNNISGTIPACLTQISFYVPQDELSAHLGGSYVLSSYGLYGDRDVEQAIGDSYLDILKVQREMWVKFTTKSISYDYEGNIIQNMSGIDLSCNKLIGQIPKEMGNLTQLRALNLSYNQLTGPIPATVSNMGQLESLDLSYNLLNGSIPIELTKMNALGTFKVRHNNLSGKIPFEAHLVTFDESSYEGNPFLCGPPLLKSCIHGERPPVESNASIDNVMNQDNGLIDMDAFYVTFTATSIVIFLATVLIMWINPHWQAVLYYLVKIGITSSYYFLENVVRKLWSLVQKCLKHFLNY